MPTLQYLTTNAQLLALEQRRVGDPRLELQVRGFLPQAATRYLNIQRLNYLWTIRHSSARMAGNLIT